MTSDNLPEDIRLDLKEAAALHRRAVSDYAKCLEFNKIMANLLDRLETCDRHQLAGKVMGILIDCNPKDGSHCDQASQIENRMKKLF